MSQKSSVPQAASFVSMVLKRDTKTMAVSSDRQLSTGKPANQLISLGLLEADRHGLLRASWPNNGGKPTKNTPIFTAQWLNGSWAAWL